MGSKGLLIAGALMVAGVVLGKIRFLDLKSFERFGTREAVSGRPFNPGLAGGPIGNLTIDGVTIGREGIATVKKHISRFDHDPANDVMISRPKKIANKELLPEEYDLNYYTHECREYQRYCNLEWETDESNGSDEHELWDNAHTATLEDFKIKNADLFHPGTKKWRLR